MDGPCALSAYLLGLAFILLAAFATWLLSLIRRDASIADALWSLLFVIAGLVYALALPAPGARTGLVLTLLVIWALRLAVHITWRDWGAPEDRRYQALRQNHAPHFSLKSLYLVFGLQGLLAWIVSLPLLAAMAGTAPLHWLDWLGLGLWTTGMIFEAGGDYQLGRFKARPDSQGKVLDTGLWRYTRHPNYFGNCCIWWGFYLIALAAGGWWSVIAPVLMTFLLLRVSGVAMLEKDIADRRPAYREYRQRTNAFLPGPPRR